MIKVSIVDDNMTVRDGLSLLINGTSGYKCLETYSSCESMLNHVEKAVPHVLLMDIELPGISGIEGIKRLKSKFPDIQIVILTVYEENDLILEGLCAGASGYLVKTIQPAKLLDAIKEAYEGGSPMSSQIARKVVTILQEQKLLTSETPDEGLKERERDILLKLAKGNTYEAIATELFISPSTVKYHLRKIYQKLQTNSKSEAIAKALRKGLIR